MKLLLFTTSGCHLCEQAVAVIAQLQADTGITLTLEEIDIADDDALIERYGIRIPVVQLPGHHEDLGWPFDQTGLAEYLALNLH